MYDSVEARVGLVCLSQWKTDNAWYRARVLSIQKTGKIIHVKQFPLFGYKIMQPSSSVCPIVAGTNIIFRANLPCRASI